MQLERCNHRTSIVISYHEVFAGWLLTFSSYSWWFAIPELLLKSELAAIEDRYTPDWRASLEPLQMQKHHCDTWLRLVREIAKFAEVSRGEPMRTEASRHEQTRAEAEPEASRREDLAIITKNRWAWNLSLGNSNFFWGILAKPQMSERLRNVPGIPAAINN